MAVATAAGNPAHPAFEKLRSERIASLNTVVEEYRHKATGAQHYHLASSDEENVFLVALRTVPMDSTGVAHVLEHTALCGSERYPVRDPFFMMIRRSLNTFMNAFTSSDWTAYPFASQNRKDFFNLLDVYLDAVFFSRLDELDFAQEGHRLEFAERENPASELQFKGVVFNEMKGAMSSPSSVLWQTLSKYLFPSTTYHYNSGGDPECIPDLTYDGLRSFYRTHYHPSNAVFMTYGDIPAHEHQARFQDLALERFERLELNISVGDEKRSVTPINVEESYAVASDEATTGKTHVVLGWLLGRSTDLRAQLEAHLLSGVLLDDSASPLRLALETTQLGAAPSPLCGVEDSNREMTFMCGIEGSEPGRAEAVEELVFEVLERVAREGVPQERVAAVLHQLELSQREIGGDGFPYGLQLVLQALSSATHRGDAVAALNLDPVLESLQAEIRDPQFISRLVREQLLDNRHRVRLTLLPDPKLAERRDGAERQRLDAIGAGLNAAQREQIVARAVALAERQNREDDPEVLPKVGLDDVPAEVPTPQSRSTSAGGMQVTIYDQGTNGLVYQQYLSQLPALAPEQVDLLPSFGNLLTEVGAANEDYLQLQARQSSVSGGISAGASVRGSVDDNGSFSGIFLVSGKALARNQEALAALLRDTRQSARFDETGRIRELIAQERAHREQSVTGSGHVLAMTAAASGISPAAALAHRLSGLDCIQRVRKLDDTLDDAQALSAFAERLASLHATLADAPAQLLLIGESSHNDAAPALLESVWAGHPPGGDTGTLSVALPRAQVRQLWTTSTQVNFCAKAYPTVPFTHPDAAVLTVLSGFLRNGFLHRAIREQGGAYGGGAGHDADSGAFRFFSYRDPRLAETLDDFDQALEWLQGEAHEWRLVEEAILGVVGALDKPASPAGEARRAFFNLLHGRTPARRQAFRQAVLAVTLADLQRVAQTYLDPAHASIAVITSAATVERDGDLDLEVCAL